MGPTASVHVDEVKRPKGPPTRSGEPEGGTFLYYIYFLDVERICWQNGFMRLLGWISLQFMKTYTLCRTSGCGEHKVYENPGDNISPDCLTIHRGELSGFWQYF